MIMNELIAICLGIGLISWIESTTMKPRSKLRSVIISFF